MNKLYFKVKKLREGAIVPSKREEDAAYDFYALLEEDFKVMMPGDLFLAPTGLAVAIPQDYVLYFAERGSTGSKGLAKRCGVVDSGYRGEVFIVLNNTSNKPIVLSNYDDERLDKFLEEKGLERYGVTVYPLSKGIAQGMIIPVPHIEVEEVDELDSNTLRGTGALGSSQK